MNSGSLVKASFEEQQREKHGIYSGQINFEKSLAYLKVDEAEKVTK